MQYIVNWLVLLIKLHDVTYDCYLQKDLGKNKVGTFLLGSKNYL